MCFLLKIIENANNLIESKSMINYVRYTSLELRKKGRKF